MKRSRELRWALACLLSGGLACERAIARPWRAGLEGFIGAPINVTTTLEIRQTGAPTLEIDASFRTKPFDLPIYWALRFTLARSRDAFAFELMHDKLFLEEPPPEVQHFEVSHGFNFLTLQRAWPFHAFRVRAGLGAILAYPENEVRHRLVDESRGLFGRGYYLSGPAALIAIERRARVLREMSLAIEARLSIAPVRVPISGGEARFTHVAAHVLLGLAFFP